MFLFTFILKNVLVMFGVIIIMVVVHEKGHFLVLKAAGGKPKTTINLFKGSKTVAFIPRDRKTEVQALSAFNAIAYGFVVLLVFMLGLSLFNRTEVYLPSFVVATAYYVIGVRQDVKNIMKYTKRSETK